MVYREAVVGCPRIERQDVNPADDVGQILVAKFLEGLQWLRIWLLHLIAVEDEERVALAESAVPWRDAGAMIRQNRLRSIQQSRRSIFSVKKSEMMQ